MSREVSVEDRWRRGVCLCLSKVRSRCGSVDRKVSVRFEV